MMSTENHDTPTTPMPVVPEAPTTSLPLDSDVPEATAETTMLPADPITGPDVDTGSSDDRAAQEEQPATDERPAAPPVEGATFRSAQDPAQPSAHVAADPADEPGDSKVWTAADSVAVLDEAPARGVRVGQLIWAGVVCLTGVFLIALAIIRNINIPMLLIGLIGLLGLGLVVSALFVGRGPSTRDTAGSAPRAG
ncbi:hypothetical protein M3T53_08355 [Actinomyces sp. B33]|uniref:hypothetical protein n=1 Tax=Actinomyces sp. B33 TaxID=2942131 RepID=UPI0023421A5E|nr:hypothetical protein [Actinomyces sp. B33]MDC4233716.1 hypothetical protein [Actinomyces sp. B33]